MTVLGAGAAVFTADQLLKASIERQAADTFPRDVPGTGGAARYEKCHNKGLLMGAMQEDREMVQLLQSRGKTIVMVLHDLAHALTYSTQIAVMQQGAILSVQPPKEVFSSGLLQSVFHVTGHCTQTETQNIYYFTPEK